MDVPNFYRLLVSSTVLVQGSDHVELESKQLDGVVAVYVDKDFVEMMLALAQEFVACESYGRNFDGQQSFELSLRLHRGH